MLFVFGSMYGNEPTPFFGGRGSVDMSVPAYMWFSSSDVTIFGNKYTESTGGSSQTKHKTTTEKTWTGKKYRKTE
jgi:hypothetical protein